MAIDKTQMFLPEQTSNSPCTMMPDVGPGGSFTLMCWLEHDTWNLGDGWAVVKWGRVGRVPPSPTWWHWSCRVRERSWVESQNLTYREITVGDWRGKKQRERKDKQWKSVTYDTWKTQDNVQKVT